jgi:hypothetical protein
VMRGHVAALQARIVKASDREHSGREKNLS